VIDNIELQELKDSNTKGGALLEKRDLSLCGHVSAQAEIVVCSLELTVSQLLELRAGNVLVSDQSIEAPMTLLLNGKAVATGNLVAVDDKFGFEVVEVAD
jgi:flagellar motor switch protein FliN/FliY